MFGYDISISIRNEHDHKGTYQTAVVLKNMHRPSYVPATMYCPPLQNAAAVTRLLTVKK